MRLLAELSDISLQVRQLFASTGSIHLQSEDALVSDGVMALTTTDALIQMFEGWWLEFKHKDCKTGSTSSKLRSLIRIGGVKLLKSYESGDGKLSLTLIMLLFCLISNCRHLRDVSISMTVILWCLSVIVVRTSGL